MKKIGQNGDGGNPPPQTPALGVYSSDGWILRWNKSFPSDDSSSDMTSYIG